MSLKTQSLTGVWHGLYNYDLTMAPVYFVATLMSGHAWLSGTSHEAANDVVGQPLTLFAALDGTIEGATISFIKTYDGTNGWDHSVL